MYFIIGRVWNKVLTYLLNRFMTQKEISGSKHFLYQRDTKYLTNLTSISMYSKLKKKRFQKITT